MVVKAAVADRILHKRAHFKRDVLVARIFRIRRVYIFQAFHRCSFTLAQLLVQICAPQLFTDRVSTLLCAQRLINDVVLFELPVGDDHGNLRSYVLADVVVRVANFKGSFHIFADRFGDFHAEFSQIFVCFI